MIRVEEGQRGGHTGPVPFLLTLPELARRRPVWAALSALFLDTELGDADYRRVARTLRDSGYAPAEWQGILRTEVAPVVGGNLFWRASGRASTRRGSKPRSWPATRAPRCTAAGPCA